MIVGNASENPNSVIKYHGRISVISRNDEFYTKSVGQLIAAASAIKTVANKDSSWSGLATEVNTMTNFVLNPENKVRKFQIDILLEGLVPYLNKLNGRIHFDKQRFRQISAIITATTDQNITHPALPLQALDEVIQELKQNKSYLWKSELLTILEAAVEKQWQPIITDNRNLLLNVGGKFLIVGLIGVVGWPLAFLYPLYRVALNMTRIATEYEKTKHVTLESGIEVAKTLVVIFASMQLLSILSVYASLGYFCLAIGGVALFFASNKGLIKQYAAVMAPHVVQIDMIVTAMDSMDHKHLIGIFKHATLGAMETANIAAGDYSTITTQTSQSTEHRNRQRSTSGNSTSSNSNTTTYTSNKVEELPVETKSKHTSATRATIATSAAAAATSNDNSISSTWTSATTNKAPNFIVTASTTEDLYGSKNSGGKSRPTSISSVNSSTSNTNTTVSQSRYSQNMTHKQDDSYHVVDDVNDNEFDYLIAVGSSNEHLGRSEGQGEGDVTSVDNVLRKRK